MLASLSGAVSYTAWTFCQGCDYWLAVRNKMSSDISMSGTLNDQGIELFSWMAELVGGVQ